jgi:hypothetical protein
LYPFLPSVPSEAAQTHPHIIFTPFFSACVAQYARLGFHSASTVKEHKRYGYGDMLAVYMRELSEATSRSK